MDVLGFYNWMINGGLLIRLDIIRLRIYGGGEEINGFCNFLWWVFYGRIGYLGILLCMGVIVKYVLLYA